MVLLTGSLEGEEPVEARWVAVEAEEAVGDPAEAQEDPWRDDRESRLVYSMTELQLFRLEELILLCTKMSLNSHLTVLLRTR